MTSCCAGATSYMTHMVVKLARTNCVIRSVRMAHLYAARRGLATEPMLAKRLSLRVGPMMSSGMTRFSRAILASTLCNFSQSSRLSSRYLGVLLSSMFSLVPPGARKPGADDNAH